MSDLASRLTLRHLRLLVTLSDLGSVTRAAYAMHVTQPAVSKAIRDLRDILGDRLFEATPDGLAWTAPGSTALQYARAMLRNLQELQEQTERTRLGKQERFAIGSTRVAEAMVSRAVPGKLLEQGLKVSLHRGSREQMHVELARRTVDVAFGRCDAGFREPDFEYHPVYQDRFIIVGATEHPLVKAGKATLRELADEAWILPPRGTFVHHLFAQAFLSENLAPPEASVLSTQGLSDLRIIENHGLLTLFPETEARRLQQAGGVACLDALPLPYLQIGAIVWRGRAPQPAVATAIELLREFTAGSIALSVGGHRNRSVS